MQQILSYIAAAMWVSSQQVHNPKENVHYKIMPCTRIAEFTSKGWYERHYMSMSGIQPSQSKNQQTNNSKNNSNNIDSKMKQTQSQKSDN